MLGNNMFAYCNNNPPNTIDPTGNYPWILPTCFEDDGRRYITDQNDAIVGAKRFGLTSVSHGGCGPIATYNTLISLGKPGCFDDVLAYYNRHLFQLSLLGFAGTPTDLVAQFFRENGCTVYVSDIPDEIDVLSKSADACILWYMFPATYGGIDAYGAHFVAYRKDGTNYIGYNTAENNGTYLFPYASDYGHSKNRYYSIGIFIFE